MAKRNTELIREAKRQGWKVKVRRGGHVRLTPPNGQGSVFMSATPSDRRAMQNSIARMRRCGFVWHGH